MDCHAHSNYGYVGMRDYNVSRIMCLREQGGRKSLEVVLCDK